MATFNPLSISDLRKDQNRGLAFINKVKQGDVFSTVSKGEVTIPKDQFVNVVTLVFGDFVAQVGGDGKSVTIYSDKKLAKQKKADFENRWSKGNIPTKSTAPERFE